jgi:hypothetical protein
MRLPHNVSLVLSQTMQLVNVGYPPVHFAASCEFPAIVQFTSTGELPATL